MEAEKWRKKQGGPGIIHHMNMRVV